MTALAVALKRCRRIKPPVRPPWFQITFANLVGIGLLAVWREVANYSDGEKLLYFGVSIVATVIANYLIYRWMGRR